VNYAIYEFSNVKGNIQAHLLYRRKLAEFTSANRFLCGVPFSNDWLYFFFFLTLVRDILSGNFVAFWKSQGPRSISLLQPVAARAANEHKNLQNVMNQRSIFFFFTVDYSKTVHRTEKWFTPVNSAIYFFSTR
jgi:hypothetical protein